MISLCMIVKNEEGNLRSCLKSAEDLVDEIIIVDTGSTDDTVSIAKQFTPNVYKYEWVNDFAKARNFSISKAKNDWVLIIDADEIINDYAKENIYKFVSKAENSNIVGRIKRVNAYGENADVRKYIERVNRLFNKKYFYYEGSIHEQVVSRDKGAYSTLNVEISMEHIGYTKDVINRTNKIERNITMLKQEISSKDKDPYLWYQLGKSYFMAKNYKEASEALKLSLKLLDDFRYEYAQDLVESLGYTLINCLEYKEALSLEKYDTYYKESPDFNFLMGLIYMNNGNFQEAVNRFELCTCFKEGKIEGITTYLPMYNIGVILECLGLTADASKYYTFCGEYVPAQERLKKIDKRY